jgi:hypothetical protein
MSNGGKWLFWQNNSGRDGYPRIDDAMFSDAQYAWVPSVSNHCRYCGQTLSGAGSVANSDVLVGNNSGVDTRMLLRSQND